MINRRNIYFMLNCSIKKIHIILPCFVSYNIAYFMLYAFRYNNTISNVFKRVNRKICAESVCNNLNEIIFD